MMVDTLLSPQQMRAMFVEAATAKFARNVGDFITVRDLVEEQGGRLHNDHGAVRIADPALTALFVRAARVIGLRRERDYLFPAKKLASFDLQVIGEDASQFKIFVSQVDLARFPPDVVERVRADCCEQADAADHGAFVELLVRAETAGGLDKRDAGRFVTHWVDKLMSRPGPPLRRSTLDAVAAVSGEAASALALGPDFNHLTIDVRAAGFQSIEAMATAMQVRGLRLLPRIQGGADAPLRQTATLAATVETPVREADGSVGNAGTEKQFVEIIERRQARDGDGVPLWRQDGQPLIYRNFIGGNAEKIFDAAATRVPG